MKSIVQLLSSFDGHPQSLLILPLDYRNISQTIRTFAQEPKSRQFDYDD